MTESIDIKNLVTGTSITLDKETSVYLLDSVDWGVVESEHRSYKYVNQIGVYVTGSTLETREISIVGWMVGENHDVLRYLRQTLNRMINPLQLHEVAVDDFRLEFLPEHSIKYSPNYAENNEVMCRFLITGYCPNPLFAGRTEERIEGATTHPKFRFPLMIPKGIPGRRDGIIMGLREPSLLIGIENTGAVPTGMRIEFYATSTVLNPSLTNALTMEFIKINKTLTAGEKVVIVTQSGEKKIVGTLGGVESNYYRYRDLNSSWLQLAMGDNLFKYDADGNLGGLEVTIYFYARYLEVE
jgi:hypothetical protein